MSKTKKAALAATLASLIILATVIFGFFFYGSASLRNDFHGISTESYDTVFLSMYPIETYSEEDFAYYRGMTVFKGEHIISGLTELKRYMSHITKSGNTVTSVYLGVIPGKVSVKELASLTERYSGISFEIIIAYPSAEYWLSLSEKEYANVLDSWQTFLTEAGSFSGARFYFYAAEEWFVTNPSLYTDTFSLTPDAAEFIFTNSDYIHPYMITAENASERSASLAQLTDILRTHAHTYPELSDTAVICFGDSIFGNYTDSMSVSGLIRTLTGATVYNCGYGGNSAAMGPETLISLPGIVNAFFAKDLTQIPADEQVYQGFTDYFENPPEGKKICYIINYGLNDYFKGYPLSSDDPYDITTYAGAIRSAVVCIKEKSADSQIILCTPSYSGYAANESEDVNAVHLKDYADAVLALAEELQVDVVDNFGTLGIDSSNYAEYLPDLVHPNEKGRFMMAQKMIAAIRQ